MKNLIGKKIGMTQIYLENGVAQPVTVVEVADLVVAKLLKNADGQVTHVELGLGKERKAAKSEIGNYKELGYVPAFKCVFKLEDSSEIYNIGDKVSIETFAVGDKIDVSGVSKGKGFQGVVKRWHFAGGSAAATHGASDKVRHPGSIGQRMTPGRVFKGMKMGGHMGMRSKTIQNLKIAQVNTEANLIAVEGSIPGANGTFMVISPAIKFRKFYK